MTTFTRSGNGANPWCDFAPHFSGWTACWSVPGAVEFEDAHGAKVTRAVPTDFLRYLDADGNGAEVVAIGVGGDDHAYLVSTAHDGFADLGLVVGNFAVAVFWNGAAFIPILVNSATTYTIDGKVKQIPIGPTSQGIRQLLNDVIIWGDDTHVREVAGRTIHKYSHIGPVFAGQRNGPDHIDLFDGGWHTPIEGSAQPPKLTALHDGSIGCCAATNHGAVFVVGPGWPELIPDTPPPVDPPPVDPPPVEPPVPEDIAKYLVPRLGLIETVKLDYPHLKGGEIVDQVAHRLNKEHDLDPIRYGRKGRNPDGSNPNDDVLTFLLDFSDNSKKKLIDILIDGGDADKPTWDVRPALEEPNNGFWTPPVNADLDDDDPPHPPDPPDPPDGDLGEAVANLQLDMAIVQANVIKQAQRITALEQAPPSGGVTLEQVNALIKAALDGGAVDGDLRKRFYTLVGKLRESKSTSRSFGHSHSFKVYEGDL